MTKSRTSTARKARIGTAVLFAGLTAGALAGPGLTHAQDYPIGGTPTTEPTTSIVVSGPAAPTSGQQAGSLPPMTLAAGGLVVGSGGLLLAAAAGVVPLAATTATVGYTPVEVPWWAAVLALGVLTAAVSYSTGIAATRRLGARLASFVGLSEVLAAVLWAWLLVGELPRPVQLVGGLLVVAGVVLVKLGEAPGRLR